VRRLEQDHDLADRHHQAVDELARRWRSEGRLAPPEADALFDHLTALQTIYREHIQLEDHELFPAAARVLSAPDIDAIGREMADRRGAPLRWEGGGSR
jgi:hemerythrin-like domain-containing protein